MKGKVINLTAYLERKRRKYPQSVRVSTLFVPVRTFIEISEAVIDGDQRLLCFTINDVYKNRLRMILPSVLMLEVFGTSHFPLDYTTEGLKFKLFAEALGIQSSNWPQED